MPPRVNHELSRMLNATITAYYNIPPEGRNKAEVLGAFGKDSSIDEELAKLATKMLPNVNRVQLETIKERVQSYQAFVDANHPDQSELSCQYPKALKLYCLFLEDVVAKSQHTIDQPEEPRINAKGRYMPTLMSATEVQDYRSTMYHFVRWMVPKPSEQQEKNAMKGIDFFIQGLISAYELSQDQTTSPNDIPTDPEIDDDDLDRWPDHLITPAWFPSHIQARNPSVLQGCESILAEPRTERWAGLVPTPEEAKTDAEKRLAKRWLEVKHFLPPAVQEGDFSGINLDILDRTQELLAESDDSMILGGEESRDPRERKAKISKWIRRLGRRDDILLHRAISSFGIWIASHL